MYTFIKSQRKYSQKIQLGTGNKHDGPSDQATDNSAMEK